MRQMIMVGLLLGLLVRAAPVVIGEVPHIKQKPDFCGEACVAMVLQQLGHPAATQDYVYNQSGLDPAEGRGCHTAELNAAMRRIGFQTGDVWTWIPVNDASTHIDQAWASLLTDLKRGIPSIVCMYYAPTPDSSEHFRLILGYDDAKDEVIYHEPAVAGAAYQRMTLTDFKRSWPLTYADDKWLLVRLRLQPDRLPEKILATAGQITAADYAQQVQTLRRQLPKQFTIMIQKPWVIAGDESPKRVKQRATQTVAWGTTRLKAQYFAKNPDQLITIYLFKDKASYMGHTQKLFGDIPGTPYGYYDETNRALIMNIATGGGTLIHEMVHPFMAANFPACPSWFNEGLASLYEQSTEYKGKIWGNTNWRLAGLQKAIATDQMETFEELTATTTDEFYSIASGRRYAHARYLCYYLQNRGLLETYYKQFVANASTDPTGYLTLQKVLKTEKMDKFQAHWQAYTQRLKFP